MQSVNNIFTAIPDKLPEELIEILVNQSGVRIERIVSCGHTSPDQGWYDQDEHEWVMVLQGSAELLLKENNTTVKLATGDHVFLPKHCKHKVQWTSSEPRCIWLAVFFNDAPPE